MKALFCDIFLLEIPMPQDFGTSNAYLLKTEEGPVLIDTGWETPEALRKLEGELGEAHTSLSEIRRILITHAHIDHFGLAARIKERSNASVALHRADAEILRPRYEEIGRFLLEVGEWLRIHGVPEEELPALRRSLIGLWRLKHIARPDELLEGGERLDLGDIELEVIWTPGHTPGHICFYEPRRKILFSGDHVLPITTPHVGLPPRFRENPLANFLSSLRKLRDLDVERVLPGHEHPFEDLRGRIEELLAHHEERTRHIMEAVEERPLSAYEIASKIPWMGAPWEKLTPLDRRLSVAETLSHLEMLAEEGKVERIEKEGRIFFKRGGRR